MPELHACWDCQMGFKQHLFVMLFFLDYYGSPQLKSIPFTSAFAVQAILYSLLLCIIVVGGI